MQWLVKQTTALRLFIDMVREDKGLLVTDILDEDDMSSLLRPHEHFLAVLLGIDPSNIPIILNRKHRSTTSLKRVPFRCLHSFIIISMISA